MKISIDLIKDFENYILSEIEELKKKGFKFIDYEKWKIQNNKDNNSVSEYQKNLIQTYFNLKQKIIVPKPRKILYSKNFVRLPEFETGLQHIEKEIINGDSILPRLSRDIFKSEKQDGMLFDFGIYHLHFGTEQDAKNCQLVKGGKEILFCLFDDEFAYFLVIDEHKKWANLDFLRIIRDSFPQKLEIWEMNDVQLIDTQINEQDRQQFRKVGINSPIELDGKFYMSPGGGFTMRGTSFQSIRIFQKQESWLRYIENTLIEHFANKIELEQKLNLANLNLSLQSLEPFVLIDKENKIYVEFDKNKTLKISTYKE